MINFPSIKLFENVVRNVKHQSTYVGKDEHGEPIYDHSKVAPKLKFRGSVKLHGTNAAIVYDVATKEVSFQSRERVITPGDDNAGFALHMSKYKEELKELFSVGTALWPDAKKIAVFGEWCGGNIQSGIGLTGLPKMFVTFAVKVIHNDEPESPDNFWLGWRWQPSRHAISMHSIDQFGHFEIEIDFEKPHLAREELIEMTLEVENECPVAKAFGNIGIGEGIVFRCVEPGYESSGFWFKSKGEKHSMSKVSTLKEVDIEAIELVNKFVDSVVTENRLEWAIQNLVREKKLPIAMESMGDFIRIVYNDVMKEEMDSIVEFQLDPKKLGGPMATKARRWFIGQFNSGRTE